MAIIASVGHSSLGNAELAGKEAYELARAALQGEPSIAFLFASSMLSQDAVLQGVTLAAGMVPVVGCSTAGEIVKEGPLDAPSAAVLLLGSPDGKLAVHIGVGENAKASERAAGRAAATEVAARAGGVERLRGLIMLADGLAGNGAEIVRGVLDVLGEHFPVVGGSAGDDFRFKETYQYAEGRVRTSDVVAIGLSGEFGFGIGVKHGWGVLGIPGKVTRATGHIVHEIDNRPAMEMYERYFGDKAKALRDETLAELAVSYPLGIKSPASDEYLIRDPLSVSAEGSITCAAEIPEGAEVRIMMGTRRSAIAMAREAAKKARADLEGKEPKAIFIFNCIARKKLLGMDAGEEIAAIREVFGKEVPLIGFYTYGEQAPVDGVTRDFERCNAVFHNETVVIYALSD